MRRRPVLFATIMAVLAAAPAQDEWPGDAPSPDPPGGISTEAAGVGGHWHSPPGVDGYVGALASDGEIIYVGGGFKSAGGVAANNVAMWDGVRWRALGAGTNAAVHALAVGPDASLYAGGTFSEAGDVRAAFVARWDGTRWAPVGGGMNQMVSVLTVDGDLLYAGGYFTQAGGAPANYIAQWDGERWDRLGGSDDPNEYIVDPMGMSWHLIGGGVDHNAFAIVPDGRGGIYVGGGFTAAYGIYAHQVAHWDGSKWTSLYSGMNVPEFGWPVNALAFDGERLYAGGYFSTAGDVAASHIAQWDGTRWAPVGNGLSGMVHALALDGDVLYAGGYFRMSGNVGVANVARWDGTRWTPLGDGVDGDVVHALLVDDGGTLHVGGDFRAAGGLPATGFACWLTASATPRSRPEVIPLSATLEPPYPAPFTTTTTLSFSLPQPADVTLRVFDAAGREIATLVDGRRAAGMHHAVFDGSTLPSGSYVARLQTDAHVASRTVVLIR